MYCETIDLYDYFHVKRTAGKGGVLTAYIRATKCDAATKLRPAALILPGGGYHFISEREGEPVATRFLNEGYSAFVLEYSLKTAYPAPLLEACMATAYIRENAERYGIDPGQVCAVGFSAGGHLTGLLATIFDDANIRQALGERAKLARPDAAILSYPVITLREEFTHGETAGNISGGDPSLRARLSIENLVNERSVPAFFWHTSEDTAVPVVNSLLAAEAYRKAGIPFELHVFEKGWHGLSVASIEVNPEENLPKVEHAAVWMDLAFTWLKKRGFAVKNV